MIDILLYIGPGLGLGTIAITLIIGGIVVLAFFYLIWLKIKRFFKKQKGTK